MRYLLSVLAAAALLFCLSPLGANAAEIRAKLLIEANTGCILSEENADLPAEPGSFSKLMTAYLTAQAIGRGELSTDTVLTAGESVVGMPGAVIWLEPGDTIPVGELLTAMLAGNANDAAAVLADAISGDQETFVMDMNAAAFDLGMRETRFTSPQGFDDPASHTTARDLSKLSCAVLRCEVLREPMMTWRTFVKGGAAEIVNENTLTRTYDGCRGVKAAHSGDSYSLIAAAERNGMLCCAIILGCSDKDERFSAAKSLLREGFSGFKLSAPGYAEEFLVPLRIRGGTEQAVLLELSQLPVLAVPGDASLTSVTVLPDFRQAPVRRGEQVGTVYFYCGDTLLTESALCAAQDVPRMHFAAAFCRMLHAILSA